MKTTITKLQLLLCLLFCTSVHLHSQVMEITNSAPITPENLISNVFLGDGVEVISITYSGDNRSVGLFTNGMEDIGMGRGIIMTTGFAVSGAGMVGVDASGNTQSASGTNSTVQDPDLQDIVGAGNVLNDVSSYTIQFIPTNDTLQFSYSFASEEYPEYVCSDFNDVFGFFISGPGISGPYQNGGDNIALIPGTNKPVTINNINPGVVGSNGIHENCAGSLGSLAFSQYYNDNQTNSYPVYDGYTDVLIAQAIVMPCSLYTIKLVIADLNDGSHDSGVFLEAKSFGTGSLNVEINGLAVDGGLAEGCAMGEITFTLPAPVESPYDVEFSVDGTATPGVDYPTLPTTIIIPEGDSTFSIPISAYDDNLVENDETIIISVQRDPCHRDTFIIVIKDNILIKPDIGPDLITCPTDENQLDATVDVPLPEPPYFVNNTPLIIDQINTPYISEIDVFGVLPVELGPEAIFSICIDSLEHRWLDDLDIFLVTPGGQFMELTTDNGADGGNGLGLDNYLGTCFTVDATTPINSPGPLANADNVPFTGNWLPEGVWSDLWDGNNPTNGTWQLVITDDTQGLIGTLFSWSITFNAVYQIEYSWDPALGLSCSDCPDPIASPDVSTTYTVTALDSYGCSEKDTINFEVLPALSMSELSCGIPTTSSVQVLWEDVIGTSGYEVSIDGGPWIPANGLLAHTINGLGLAQNVEIIVRGIADCPSFPDTIICSSLNCTPAGLSATPSPASCFSGTDGSVQINIENGTGPFSYAFNGETNASGLFENLVAGTHIAVVTDGDGCPGSIEFIIEEPPSPTFTFVTEQALSCNGDMNGALTIDIQDGNGPFVFNWDNATTDSIATNLSVGDYNVQLTDVANCIYDLSLSLEEPILLEATIDAIDALCAATNTGQAWISPTGGTGNYTYLWTDGQILDTAFLLTAATYEVTITDVFNCTIILDVTINEPAPLLLSNPLTSPVLCNGDATGSSSIEISGGTIPYEAIWTRPSTGATVGNQPSAIDLLAGNYDVLVTDANGCTENTSLSVTEPDALEILNLQTGIPSCVGLVDGTGQIDIQGGSPIYTTNWDNGSIGIINNSLNAANHWVAVQDINNCTDTLFFILDAPEAITLSFTADSVSCFGFSDGTALVEPQGGAIPYSYSWDSGATTALAPNLTAGIQTVEVYDANNCLTEGEVEVFSSTLLELNLSATDPSCFEGNDGTAVANTQGGTIPYSYAWNDGQSNNEAINLNAQTIAIIVTDANACTAMAEVTLDEPELLTTTSSAEEQSCSGLADGEASINPTGGTMPYNYSWGDGQTSPTATALTAGLHVVTVTDNQDCSIETTINVPMAETVSITSFDQTNVSCNGGNDGFVNVQLSGGTPPFSWSQPLSSLQATSYSLTVTDANNCTDILDITIEEPAALLLNTAITHIVCAGEQSGALDLSVSGGISPYNYLWSTNAITEDINNLSSTNYTVSVTDANGCIQTLESTVNEATELSLTTSFINVDCFGSNSGSISIEGKGGEFPYTYAWTNGSVEAQQNTLIAGNYTLTMTDTYGCEITQNFTIAQPDPLTAQFSTKDVDCFGGRDGILKIEAAGGTPPFRYRYNGDFWQNSPTFIGIEAGVCNLQLEDANGCPLAIGTATINEPPAITIDLGGDRDIRFGESANITPIVHSQNQIVSYQWLRYDSTWMACETCIDQVVFPDYTSDLFLFVKDENDCTGEEWVRIRVSKDFPVYVATGFTPNGDFINDLLIVQGLPGIKVLSFRVWDRWGEKLYDQSDFDINNNQIGWDGSFRGQTMNGDVFLWRVEVLLPDGKTEQLTGQTTLIR